MIRSPGIPEDRLSLGYFYVQADKIYKIEPSEENISRLKTSEELPEGSVIVCQDEEIKDTLGEDEPGSHHWLEANGEKESTAHTIIRRLRDIMNRLHGKKAATGRLQKRIRRRKGFH